MSGPQNRQFHYIMYSTTLHKTSCIYIYFSKLFILYIYYNILRNHIVVFKINSAFSWWLNNNFENELFPTTVVEQRQHVVVVGCHMVCSGLISMFAFDILQIPSGQDSSGKITCHSVSGQKWKKWKWNSPSVWNPPPLLCRHT